MQVLVQGQSEECECVVAERLSLSRGSGGSGAGNMLADTILQDRYEQLVQLVTMIGDRGELPIAMALASVVSSGNMDELARVLVTVFDSRHMLSHLLYNIFYREVEGTESLQTLLRGNSLGSKTMAHCFKIYGTAYLKDLLEPLILPLLQNDSPQRCFEVDPSRMKETEQVDIQVNRKNLEELTQLFFDRIMQSAEEFPPQLRSMAHSLHQVLNSRFPDSRSNTSAVGTVFFLRFINPAIVSPYENGVISERIESDNTRRGLMLMSKILQNIANQVEFSKEQHMMCFNDFLRNNFEAANVWVKQITSDCESHKVGSGTGSSAGGSSSSSSSGGSAIISDANICALHRLLWTHQEQMRGHLCSSSRYHKLIGKRPFDKMSALLSSLGPPGSRGHISDTHSSSSERHACLII